MARDQLEQVFTPFSRAHANRDAELGIEGLGLGLSVVRERVEAIGASINVTGAARPKGVPLWQAASPLSPNRMVP